MRIARIALVTAAFASLDACRGDAARTRQALDSGAATGDVSADSAAVGTVFHGVKYPLTSDNYRKWTVAQASLDSLPEPADLPRVDLRNPTDDDIDAAVAYLSRHHDERAAIERSGLSVRDFVLTSVALGQAFRFGGDTRVPSENRAFVASNRDAVVHVRESRRFHVLDDDDDEDEDGGDRRGHGHGHRHGHGHGKHKGKH